MMNRGFPYQRRFRAVLLLLFLLVHALGLPGAFAEEYLSIEEARKILFPQATSFEGKIIRFTATDRKRIAKRIDAKVRNQGHRVWQAFRGDEPQGVLVLDHVLGKHQLIDYAVAISPQGKVLGVEILVYRESHGGEIRQKKWRDQFTEKSSASPLRLNDDIYNISGATISCRNVTEGIRRVLATYDLVLRPRLVPNP